MVCLFKRRQRVVVENEVNQNKNRKILCHGHFKLCKCIKCNFYLKYFFLHFSDKVHSVHLGVAKGLHLYFLKTIL